jgi:hypothetical protein
MKNPLHFIFFSFLIFLTGLSFAQTASEPISIEKNYKWSIGVQINTVETIPGFAGYSGYFSTFFQNVNQVDKSFSTGILANYFINNNVSARIRIGITKRNMNEAPDTTGVAGMLNGNYTYGNSSLTETNIHIAPGLQWNTRKDKVALYGGIEIPYNIIGQIKTDGVGRKYTNYVLTSTINNSGTFTGGESYGVGVFTGINFYPCKRITIGTEFSLAYIHTKVGGKQAQNGSVFYNGTYEASGISDLKGSINVSFFF